MRHLAALLLAAMAAAAPSARAQDGVFLDGTMRTVGDRGTIRIGYRDGGAVPFSFLNPGRQPVGFSVDLCHAIAEDAAAALHQDLLEPGAPAWQQGLRLEFVAVPADARLPMLMDGRIDLECSSTTANAERSRSIAFSPVFFLAGTKLAVPVDSPAAGYQALAGKTVAVPAGTTNATVLGHLLTTPPLKVTPTPGLDAAYTLLTQGQADAVASDDILLAGLLASHAATKSYKVIGDYLSFEPYAIGLRRNDPAFAALVQQSFTRLADSGALTAAYNRWFTDKLPGGETLNLPMSNQLAEIFRGLGAGN